MTENYEKNARISGVFHKKSNFIKIKNISKIEGLY